jgi:sterol desaturase/sphingolipid hydroxylase (fatty acid hydroxylase superfamily)
MLMLLQDWNLRSRRDKLLDAVGLLTQGAFVPLAAQIIANELWPMIFSSSAKINIPNGLLFLLPLTLIDYLFYWNHRLLHRTGWWLWHRTHHTAKKLDIFVSSRNSVWTVFLLVYIWTQSLIIYWVENPNYYIYGMYVFSALDLWRHCGIQTPGWLRPLGIILILPEDHEWHHSLEKSNINFGANLNIWDRFHGTFYRPQQRAQHLGDGQHERTLIIDLLMPWKVQS